MVDSVGACFAIFCSVRFWMVRAAYSDDFSHMIPDSLGRQRMGMDMDMATRLSWSIAWEVHGIGNCALRLYEVEDCNFVFFSLCIIWSSCC
jgi:hypothetical protein